MTESITDPPPCVLVQVIAMLFHAEDYGGHTNWTKYRDHALPLFQASPSIYNKIKENKRFQLLQGLAKSDQNYERFYETY